MFLISIKSSQTAHPQQIITSWACIQHTWWPPQFATSGAIHVLPIANPLANSKTISIWRTHRRRSDGWRGGGDQFITVTNPLICILHSSGLDHHRTAYLVLLGQSPFSHPSQAIVDLELVQNCSLRLVCCVFYLGIAWVDDTLWWHVWYSVRYFGTGIPSLFLSVWWSGGSHASPLFGKHFCWTGKVVEMVTQMWHFFYRDASWCLEGYLNKWIYFFILVGSRFALKHFSLLTNIFNGGYVNFFWKVYLEFFFMLNRLDLSIDEVSTKQILANPFSSKFLTIITN